MDYARFASTSARLIERSGAPVILRRTTRAEHNAATGDIEGAAAEWSGKAVRLDYDLRDIDGDLIQRGDARFFMSVFQDNGQPMPEPALGDELQFDSAWWRVLACTPLKPATVAVVYEVQARK